MSNRPETTKILSLSAEKHVNPYNDTRIYWAREVTFDYSTSKMKFHTMSACMFLTD